MTTFLLVRHASTDAVGRRLTGRRAGVPLNAAGRAQAARLSERLRACPIAAVYSSPLERAWQTAAAVAAPRGLPVHRVDELTEMDVGEWTGAALADMSGTTWTRFHVVRSLTRAPGGEMMLEVQARAVAALERLRLAHAQDVVLVVTHAEVIRALLAHLLGAPLDLALRIDVDPASISVADVGDDWIRLRCVNERDGAGPVAGPVADDTPTARTTTPAGVPAVKPADEHLGCPGGDAACDDS